MSFFSNEQELDEKCNSMKTQKGKMGKRYTNARKEAPNCDLKKHIEANHLEGIAIPCNVFFKTFKSRNAKDQYSRVYHKR